MTGMVWLVGAGPGDPALATAAARAVLAEADAVVYDRLAPPELLTFVPDVAERHDVGKGPGRHAASQDEINELLVRLGREGKRVVRLKGGDPFVFGRGGEEAEALAAVGIPFAVVPGVTSAVAVPAYAGIPLTHREVASSFAVVTGHEEPGRATSRIDWAALARATDTLVLLMGVATLEETARKLMENGRAAGTPAAVVQWGTTPRQRTVSGTLGDIAARAREAGLESPAVTVVGEVVGLRERLRWFDNRPLFGKRVLVTRTRQQASALAELLRAEGAEPVELPTIEIVECVDRTVLEEAMKRLHEGTYAWAVFTSENGVDCWFRHMQERYYDARLFGRTRICAIGPGTAGRLRERGIIADLVPERYVAEAVVEDLLFQGVRDRWVLVPRAAGGRDVLVEGLRGAGARVDEVVLYEAALPQDGGSVSELLRRGGLDVLTFTSSSTVRNFARMAGDGLRELGDAVVACIGPVTADTARELGLPVHVVAREHTVPGLVAALRGHFTEEVRR